MPAPGYEFRQLEIDITPGVCTAEDWDALAGYLAGLRYFTLREAITLRLATPPADENAAAETENINNTRSTASTSNTASARAASWRVTGAPVLRSPPTTPSGAGALLFSAFDDAGSRVQLRLFRDAASGALTLQPLSRPPVPPGLPPRPAHSGRRAARPAPPPFVHHQP
jgi:hypothetical protein